MRILFVHQNFPAQFRYLAPRLASESGWECAFVTTNTKAPDLPGVERIPYRRKPWGTAPAHSCVRAFEGEVRHALGVYDALKKRADVRPDLIVAHSGFGSSLYLPYLYDAPVINFFEYFHRPVGQTFGYRPDVPVHEEALLRCRTDNSMILLDLDNCDRGWCPNFAQREVLPKEYHDSNCLPSR